METIWANSLAQGLRQSHIVIWVVETHRAFRKEIIYVVAEFAEIIFAESVSVPTNSFEEIGGSDGGNS